MPKFLTGLYCCKHSLPNTYQNSIFPEGKQVLSINYIVCTKSLGTVKHPCYVGSGGKPPKIQIPKCQPRTNLATGFSKDTGLRPMLINPYLHTQLLSGFQYFLFLFFPILLKHTVLYLLRKSFYFCFNGVSGENKIINI